MFFIADCAMFTGAGGTFFLKDCLAGGFLTFPTLPPPSRPAGREGAITADLAAFLNEGECKGLGRLGHLIGRGIVERVGVWGVGPISQSAARMRARPPHSFSRSPEIGI